MPRDGLIRCSESPPTSVAELAAGERLLLWAYRLWLEGLIGRAPARHERVWRGLSRELGPARARRLLTALSRLIYRCVQAAAGEIAFNPSCCRRVGADEHRLLGLVAAAGRAPRTLAEARAAGLLRGGRGGELVAPAAEIAAVLEEAGYGLPSRPVDARSDAILRAAEALPLLDRRLPN